MNSKSMSNTANARFAQAAIDELGWWRAHKFLFLRRASQLCVLLAFAIGPWFGLWLLKGNLSSSELLATIPLSDPLATLQVLMTGHWPELSLLLGAAIIALFYLVTGGRVFCSWVCPVNLVTDTASWLRRKLHLPRTSEMPRNLRYYLLAVVLLMPLFSGIAAWEWVNPVPVVYRALLFGAGSSLWILAAIFLLDLFISERAWCGHLCPTGAMFALLGKASPVKISAVNAKDCDNCMDCFEICPERQVLKPALKGKNPMITDSDCTQCGRCIDVCAQRVFQYQNRIALKAENNQ
ncbi:quinol dehydrogenase ferredoxin subunit NapH [Shewanella psychrotolerans]|uniref:quinol dehydrogenase ferredoxin subunit NapH n=1 Tax=Shewanella psychrotolerans TaxID=2864206 RepID=UPI001C65F992|nr:quinol dehydrogenase ferredoxin subunit NapH [Shewanella psychrotolerans]QYK00926.1 quinol dehydrogenase ferredoxin subunit NapH [Shewanella psychrotolerans]